VLKDLGIEDKRLRMTFVSASEGAKWGKVVEDVVKTITTLGPSPIKALSK
jgi:coenzyme F420-reducing hydrogenase delta subunit